MNRVRSSPVRDAHSRSAMFISPASVNPLTTVTSATTVV